MNRYLKRSLELENETLRHRRTIHKFAETGFDLPNTKAYVMETLKELGVSPVEVGKSGVSALIGNPGGKTMLLRGDMDALPMGEESGLSFAADNGNCHSCGHDCHTAMLLTAAKLLKEQEKDLKGYVKLMFQPAEELLAGAQDMIDHGILENPKVDAAMGLHIGVGTERDQVGMATYCSGPATFSGDAIAITIHGKDAHGSTPEAGVDAINIAAHVVIALQEVLAREVSCRENCVLIIGKITGGTTCNTLAGTAVLEASARATTPENRAFLKQRIKEVAESVAATFRGRAEVTYVYGIPPMVTDVVLSRELALYCEEILGEGKTICVPPNSGTEDFTAIAERVPSAFYFLGAGSPEEGCSLGAHHPAMKIKEEVLPLGAAMYANCAAQFLEQK